MPLPITDDEPAQAVSKNSEGRKHRAVVTEKDAVRENSMKAARPATKLIMTSSEDTPANRRIQKEDKPPEEKNVPSGDLKCNKQENRENTITESAADISNLSLKEQLLAREKIRQQEERENREKRRKRHYQTRTRAIPQVTSCLSEEKVVFTEKDTEEMYKLIGVSSNDIGFSWPTEMLMHQIISIIYGADTDEDIEGGIMAIRNGDKIWAKLKKVLAPAKKIAGKEM